MTIGEWWQVFDHIENFPFEEEFFLSLPSGRFHFLIREADDDDNYQLPEPNPVVIKKIMVTRRTNDKLKKARQKEERKKFFPPRMDIMSQCKCKKGDTSKCPLHEKPNITCDDKGTIRPNR